MLEVLLLVARALVAYPHADPLAVAAAARASVLASETSHVDARLIFAIAEHESDLRRFAVSFKLRGQARVDRVVEAGVVPPTFPQQLACGYLSAIALDHEACSAMMLDDGGMRAGLGEIVEWLGTARGDVRCALAGQAGGNAGFRACLDGRETQATQFADYFLAAAARLGYQPRKGRR